MKIFIENEALFISALRNGLNVFCGAGFSVGAYNNQGEQLPIGNKMLEELKEINSDIKSYTKLPFACTKFEKTDRTSFLQYINTRFKVKSYDKDYKYNELVKLPIKNVYTTNVDDLWYKILDSSNTKYLYNKAINGAVYNDDGCMNYFPLHGCVRNGDGYVFGTLDIVNAFFMKNESASWESLQKASANFPILFWGWNFEDTGPLQAMYKSYRHNLNDNISKWFVLFGKNPDESDETVDFLKTLGFNLIYTDTKSLLDYITDFNLQNSTKDDDCKEDGDSISSSFKKKYEVPKVYKGPVYPKKAYFIDYTPRWFYFINNMIPKTAYYKTIVNYIAGGKNTIVYGIRGSGKTSLYMQIATNYKDKRLKLGLIAPMESQTNIFLKELNGRSALVLVDDCFRDTKALLLLLKAKNVQVVGFDRDFNYERQYHQIENEDFVSLDITNCSKEDAQEILSSIPKEILKNDASTKNFDKDPTIPVLLAKNLRKTNFNFIYNFYEQDNIAAEIFLLICYVHYAGVPCSFDMIYSYLGDKDYTWEQMYQIVERSGGLVSQANDFFGSFSLREALEDYYQCRSRFFAEKILKSMASRSHLLGNVLMNFVNKVPIYKICEYDRFRRNGYDSLIVEMAFQNISDGEEFYRLCANKDDTEYIYQQAAIYFSNKREYEKAFEWIDKARNRANYNRFSIQSTYAQIYFKANVSFQESAKEALNQLSECCKSDKRKSIHFIAFAKCVIEYNELYDTDDCKEFKRLALNYIEEGLKVNNKSLSMNHKYELRDLQKKLLS